MQQRTMKRLIVAMVGLVSAGMWSNQVGAEAKGQDAAVQQVLRKAQGVVRQLTEEKAALETQKAALETEKTALLGQKSALETQKSALEAEKSALIKEKAKLQGEKTTLESRLKKTEETLKPLQPLPAKLKRCEVGVESLQIAKAGLESQLVETRNREREAIQSRQEIIVQAQAIEDDNRLLLDAVKEREVWINACGKRNQDLVKAGREAVNRYREKGFWEQVADAEPVTGIGKVRTEDAAQAYRYKIEHLKAAPFQPEIKLPESVTEAAPNGGGGEKTQ
jgi:chromosome segregation ATPase